MIKNSNFSNMNDEERFIYISTNWLMIKTSTEDIMRENSILDELSITKLLPVSFSEELVLGQGMWGIVVKTRNPKLVVKITSDILELSLIDLLLSDRKQLKGLKTAFPYIAGIEIFPDLNGIIVREDIKVGGVVLSPASPITRAVNTLITDYVNPLSDDETAITRVLLSEGLHSFRDVSYAHIILKGASAQYSKRALSKIKTPTVNSKSHSVIEFVKFLLRQFGIALIDLHADNLGFLKHDIQDIFEVKRSKEDYNRLIVTDLGLAYDTPIYIHHSHSKTLEEREQNFSVVLNRLVDLYYRPSDEEDSVKEHVFDVHYYLNKKRQNPAPSSEYRLLRTFNNLAISLYKKGIDPISSVEFSDYTKSIAQDITSTKADDVESEKIFLELLETIKLWSNRNVKINYHVSIDRDKKTLGLPFYTNVQEYYTSIKNGSKLRVMFDNKLSNLTSHERPFDICSTKEGEIIIYAILPLSERYVIDKLINALKDNRNPFELYIPLDSVKFLNGFEVGDDYA